MIGELTKQMKTQHLALRLFLGSCILAGCGDNRTKDKLMSGILAGSSSSGSSAAIQRMALIVKGVANGGAGLSAPFGYSAPAVVQAVVSDGSVGYNSATGFYEGVVVWDSRLGSGTVVRYRVQNANGDPIRFGHYVAGDTSVTLSELLTIRSIRKIVDGTDAKGNKYLSDTTISGFTMTQIGQLPDFGQEGKLNGTVSISGAIGDYTFQLKDVVMGMSGGNIGKISAGSIEGTGQSPPNPPTAILLQFNGAILEGTATSASESIAIRIEPDGSGTYTDSNGVHLIL